MAQALQQVEVQLIDGRPMVSSLKVAEHFGKRHKNVIRAIKSLDVPEDFKRLNFEPVEYVDRKGEKRPAYLMTRDGFVLLAMGFTGRKAMEWKIRYIEAFNAMERKLMEQAQNIAGIVNTLRRQIVRDVRECVREVIENACSSQSALACSYPFRVAKYKGKPVRFLIKKGQLALYAQDYVRELTGRASTASTQVMRRFGGEFIVENIRDAASEYFLSPGEFLKKLELSVYVRSFTYIPVSGFSFISSLSPDFYDFICREIFPEVPVMLREYKQVVHNARLQEVGRW